MELTFDEAIMKHRELWGIIVKLLEDGIEYGHPDDYKIESLAIMKEKEIPYLYCYCCDYIHQNGFTCDKCILKWCNSHCGGSEYDDLRLSLENSDYIEALRIAKMIRDLPERR